MHRAAVAIPRCCRAFRAVGSCANRHRRVPAGRWRLPTRVGWVAWRDRARRVAMISRALLRYGERQGDIVMLCWNVRSNSRGSPAIRLACFQPRSDRIHASGEILFAQQSAAEHDVSQGQELPLRPSSPPGTVSLSGPCAAPFQRWQSRAGGETLAGCVEADFPGRVRVGDAVTRCEVFPNLDLRSARSRETGYEQVPPGARLPWQQTADHFRHSLASLYVLLLMGDRPTRLVDRADVVGRPAGLGQGDAYHAVAGHDLRQLFLRPFFGAFGPHGKDHEPAFLIRIRPAPLRQWEDLIQTPSAPGAASGPAGDDNWANGTRVSDRAAAADSTSKGCKQSRDALSAYLRAHANSCSRLACRSRWARSSQCRFRDRLRRHLREHEF